MPGRKALRFGPHEAIVFPSEGKDTKNWNYTPKIKFRARFFGIQLAKIPVEY